MDTTTVGPEPGSRGVASGRRLRRWLVAAGAALGLILAGLGVAVAQTDGTNPGPGANAQAPNGPGPDAGAPGPGPKHGRGGKGRGMGIHGEFVTRAPGGGYQTLATQMGEVTDVSESSIAVRSEDGFTRTYGVDDNTLVNAGNQGIADVKKGDQVHVIAVVRDGKASAVDVRDATQIGQARGRWNPRPAPPPGGDRPQGNA